MKPLTDRSETDDPYDLQRFVDAQQDDYQRALAEIQAGQKRTHWMWYIFPQLSGLGLSPTSQRYAIRSAQEAQAYLDHPLLGKRLHAVADAVLQIQGRSAAQIFGSPDDLKLKSSATLFATLTPAGSVFDRLLDKYFGGQRDAKTLRLLGDDHA